MISWGMASTTELHKQHRDLVLINDGTLIADQAKGETIFTDYSLHSLYTLRSAALSQRSLCRSARACLRALRDDRVESIQPSQQLQQQETIATYSRA